jgi:hypothetical protein
MPNHMTAEFVESTEWPANSPDSNLFDYNALNEFKELV